MNVDTVELLLVEDDPRDLELTLRALAQHRSTTRLHVVRDGAKALEFLFPRKLSRSPDSSLKLILLDLKIPKVTGLEVLRRIKSDERTKEIPVVVLTSSSQKRDILDSYRLGANSYVVKPVEFDEFITCVSHLGRYWLACNEPPR